MEIGTGIAVSSAVLGIVAVIFKLFSFHKDQQHCPEHSGLCADIINFTKWLNKIEAKLDKVIEER
ncbi:MAG: hypothetical protein ACLQSX_11170 [Smithella sp.]